MWNQDRLKGILRQASGFKPKHVFTDKEYDKLEETYRNVRDEFVLLLGSVRKLKDYEHDGTTYKMLKEGFEKAKGKEELEDEDIVDNMYKVMNTTLIKLSNAYTPSSNKEMAQKLVDYNKKISDDKHNMNKELKKIIGHIKYMKNESIRINNARTIMKNIQYDADNAVTKEKKVNPNQKAEDKPEIQTKISMFKENQEQTRRMMTDFLNHENHKLVLNGLHDVYKKYYK